MVCTPTKPDAIALQSPEISSQLRSAPPDSAKKDREEVSSRRSAPQVVEEPAAKRPRKDESEFADANADADGDVTGTAPAPPSAKRGKWQNQFEDQAREALDVLSQVLVSYRATRSSSSRSTCAAVQVGGKLAPVPKPVKSAGCIHEMNQGSSNSGAQDEEIPAAAQHPPSEGNGDQSNNQLPGKDAVVAAIPRDESSKEDFVAAGSQPGTALPAGAVTEEGGCTGASSLLPVSASCSIAGPTVAASSSSTSSNTGTKGAKVVTSTSSGEQSSASSQLPSAALLELLRSVFPESAALPYGARHQSHHEVFQSVGDLIQTATALLVANGKDLARRVEVCEKFRADAAQSLQWAAERKNETLAEEATTQDKLGDAQRRFVKHEQTLQHCRAGQKAADAQLAASREKLRSLQEVQQYGAEVFTGRGPAAACADEAQPDDCSWKNNSGEKKNEEKQQPALAVPEEINPETTSGSNSGGAGVNLPPSALEARKAKAQATLVEIGADKSLREALQNPRGAFFEKAYEQAQGLLAAEVVKLEGKVEQDKAAVNMRREMATRVEEQIEEARAEQDQLQSDLDVLSRKNELNFLALQQAKATLDRYDTQLQELQTRKKKHAEQREAFDAKTVTVFDYLRSRGRVGGQAQKATPRSALRKKGQKTPGQTPKSVHWPDQQSRQSLVQKLMSPVRRTLKRLSGGLLDLEKSSHPGAKRQKVDKKKSENDGSESGKNVKHNIKEEFHYTPEPSGSEEKPLWKKRHEHGGLLPDEHSDDTF
ncbi:unnamed protein product [Amoebophrya sp. A120]|nr:unnamed protein product [Amoebophrya sp. A120]|eukprot:GSA120T00007930001.1